MLGSRPSPPWAQCNKHLIHKETEGTSRNQNTAAGARGVDTARVPAPQARLTSSGHHLWQPSTLTPSRETSWQRLLEPGVASPRGPGVQGRAGLSAGSSAGYSPGQAEQRLTVQVASELEVTSSTVCGSSPTQAGIYFTCIAPGDQVRLRGLAPKARSVPVIQRQGRLSGSIKASRRRLSLPACG